MKERGHPASTGFRVEPFELVEPIDRGREVRVEQEPLLSVPEPAHAEDRKGRAGFAQRGALFGERDAEPRRPGFGGGRDNATGSVAIGVGLYDREHVDARADEFLERADVPAHGVETDLRRVGRDGLSKPTGWEGYSISPLSAVRCPLFAVRCLSLRTADADC